MVQKDSDIRYRVTIGHILMPESIHQLAIGGSPITQMLGDPRFQTQSGVIACNAADDGLYDRHVDYAFGRDGVEIFGKNHIIGQFTRRY